MANAVASNDGVPATALYALPEDVWYIILNMVDWETVKAFSVCSRKCRPLACLRLFRSIDIYNNVGVERDFDLRFPSLMKTVVKSITIRDCGGTILLPSVKLLSSFTNLRRLMIRAGGDTFPLSSMMFRSPLVPHSLPNLRSLTIEVARLSLLDLLDVLRLPNLVDLELRECSHPIVYGKPDSELAATHERAVLEQLSHASPSPATSLVLVCCHLDRLIAILPLLVNVRKLQLEKNRNLQNMEYPPFPNLEYLDMGYSSSSGNNPWQAAALKLLCPSLTTLVLRLVRDHWTTIPVISWDSDVFAEQLKAAPNLQVLHFCQDVDLRLLSVLARMADERPSLQMRVHCWRRPSKEDEDKLQELGVAIARQV